MFSGAAILGGGAGLPPPSEYHPVRLSHPKPPHCRGIVLRHAPAVLLHGAEVELGRRVALLGQRTLLAQRRRIVAAPVSRQAFVEPRPGR